MRRRGRELTFRALAPSDETFAANLAARVFSDWSRDPAQAMLGMLRARSAVAEIAMSQTAKGEDRLGFFVLTTRRLPRPFGPIATPVTAHLDAIAVIPRAIGRGIGGALLHRAEARARAHGAVVMRLMTATGNAAAQHLFTKHGYLKTHTTFGAYANDEDAFEMFKPL